MLILDQFVPKSVVDRTNQFVKIIFSTAHAHNFFKTVYFPNAFNILSCLSTKSWRRQ